jgi:hypothetical protein
MIVQIELVRFIQWSEENKMPEAMRVESTADLEKELERRKANRALLQTKSDVDEINRRIKSVEDGSVKLMDENESKAMLKKLGYYG